MDECGILVDYCHVFNIAFIFSIDDSVCIVIGEPHRVTNSLGVVLEEYNKAIFERFAWCLCFVGEGWHLPCEIHYGFNLTQYE